jgi:hypothetical protein
MERSILYEIRDRAAPAIVRVDLNERLGPIASAIVLGVDGCSDIRRSDASEAARERRVLVDDLAAEIEDVKQD